MNEFHQIPDVQTRQRSVKRLREVSRELDVWGLELDELIAMAEAEIRHQRRQRLEGKYKKG